MKVAFLTEMGFEGEVSSDYPNMRTEFAWMNALNAIHYNISKFDSVNGYDHVFIIFPKGMTYLNSIGVKLMNAENPISHLLTSNIIERLKFNNKKIHFVQEGPHWLWNDYEIDMQIYYYNMIASCDSIFCHNKHDVSYYKGMYPDKKVDIIPSLMLDELLTEMVPIKEDKVIIGGNFSRWYGGFESYLTAQEFDLPIWSQTSHATREGESELLNHLPRLFWKDWMAELKNFKFAVHLMPTIAAGTFSLNCAYFGIPCIGNIEVDTQVNCYPDLSVQINDIKRARQLAKLLVQDIDFYNECSKKAKNNYNVFYNKETFISKILDNL